MITAKLYDETGTELADIERDDWQEIAQALGGFLEIGGGADFWRGLSDELVTALQGVGITAEVSTDDGDDEAASCDDHAWALDADDDDDHQMTGDAECQAM